MGALVLIGLLTALPAGALCPIDQRTGADLETDTKFDWYAEVRYTYAMAVGSIANVSSFETDLLPQCSRPVLVSINPEVIWRKEIRGPIKAIADDDVGLLAVGTQVLVYFWDRYDLPHPIALIKRLDEAGTERGYLNDSIYDRFEIDAAIAVPDAQ